MNRNDKIDQQVQKILVGDLAAAKFSVLTSWLKKEGIAVDFFNQFEMLLEKVKEESYELCLINWLLGGTGPFEIIRKIRENSKNTQIKIVVVTRQVQKINIQNAIKAGAQDFVAEPFENELLLKRLLYHLAPQDTIDADAYEFNPIQAPVDVEPVNLLVEVCEHLSHAERGTESVVLHEVLSKVG